MADSEIVLLAHDDISTIAAVKRLLSQENLEVFLATSTADAVASFSHLLPSMLVLAPALEGGLGATVWEELAAHPHRSECQLILLGESISGTLAPVISLPLDGRALLQAVQSSKADRMRWNETTHPGSPPAAEIQTAPGPAATPEPESDFEPPPPLPQLLLSAQTNGLGLALALLEKAKIPEPTRWIIKAESGVRTLWLDQQMIAGALSSSPYESILIRARLDGFIDLSQETALRSISGEDSAVTLQLMVEYGWLREKEVPSFARRFTQELVSGAVGESILDYQVFASQGSVEGVIATSIPLLPVLFRGVRNRTKGSEIILGAGGIESVPTLTSSFPYLNELGLSEKEQALLVALSSEKSFRQVVSGSGLSSEEAASLLGAAAALGWVEWSAPPVLMRVGSEAVAQLEAKWASLEEADYFSILALPRTATGADVGHAQQLLLGEFNPLKFVGHPDAILQQRAGQVQVAINDAADALREDSLRSLYAMHLAEGSPRAA